MLLLQLVEGVQVVVGPAMLFYEHPEVLEGLKFLLSKVFCIVFHFRLSKIILLFPGVLDVNNEQIEWLGLPATHLLLSEEVQVLTIPVAVLFKVSLERLFFR